MKQSTAVLIIGGGVIGASVAYHLASRGCKNIIVLERGGVPGEGSTGKATGGFRCQFSTEVNVRLSLLGREKLLRFKDELDIDSGYRQYGYLFLASHDNELQALRDGQAIQRQAGLQTAREISSDEIHLINSFVNREGIIGGVFCPTDGFIRPINILQGYMEGAKRLGVQFLFGVECKSFKMYNGTISGLDTSEGVFYPEHVVNAGGAWAGEIAKLARIHIPVTPLKRQVAVTFPTSILPEEMPMTIFTSDGFHLRVRDGRVLLLMPADFSVKHPFDISFDEEWMTRITIRAREAIPCLKNVQIDRDKCWAGLYEMSPDKHAILGKAPGVENFYLVNGSSGHGVMHSPALGQLLSEIIIDGTASSMHIDALSPSRFAEGKLNPTNDVL